MKNPAQALINDPRLIVSKSVEWSYPSSPNAVHFGFARSGCWTVQRCYSHPEHSILPEALSAHEDRGHAIDVARSLPDQWSAIFLNYYPIEEVDAPELTEVAVA